MIQKTNIEHSTFNVQHRIKYENAIRRRSRAGVSPAGQVRVRALGSFRGQVWDSILTRKAERAAKNSNREKYSWPCLAIKKKGGQSLPYPSIKNQLMIFRLSL
jgi:hypothetical protein